jgi:hypothetical protein
MTNTAKQTAPVDIGNLHKNRLGTVSFDGKFEGMRKAQEFDVYPITSAPKTEAIKATIQSDTRIGSIDLSSGEITVTRSIASGAYFPDLAQAKHAGKLTGEQLESLKAHIFGTAHEMAGTNGIMYCNNAGAASLGDGAQQGTAK